MTLANNSDTDYSKKLEQILKPLGNETRQKLLMLIARGPITYTEIYNQLKLESGSFYWHINKMSHLVTQTQDKKYKLSDLGKKAFDLLTFDGEFSKTKYSPFWFDKIQQFMAKVDQIPLWIMIQEIVIFIFLISYVFSKEKLIQLGSFPIQYDNANFIISLVSIIITLLTISFLVLITLWILEKKSNRSIDRVNIIKIFILLLLTNLGLMIPGIFSSTIIYFSNNTNIGLNIFILFPLTFMFTIISIIATMSLINLYLDYGFNNSLLLLLISYYPFIILSFLIQSSY